MAEDPYGTRRRRPARVPEPVTPPPPAAPPPPEMSELRRWLGMGVRGVGGLAGFTPMTGAAFGGGADVLAQMIEKNTWDPSDVDYLQTAAEAGVGAIGGTYAKALSAALGKPLTAAVKGATLGAAMPVARHGIQEGDFNPLNYPGEVATSAAISGATGGALAKFFGGKTPPAGPSYQVDSTAVPGGQVLGPGGRGTQLTQSPRTIQGSGQPIPTGSPASSAGDLGKTPYIGQPAAPLRSQEALIAREAREAEAIAKRAEAARLNDEKLTRIENAISEGGLERGAPSVGESISATTPEGATQRMGYRFRAPEAEDEAGDALGTLLRGGPDAPVSPAAPVDDAAAIEAKIAELEAQMGPVDTTPPISTPDASAPRYPEFTMDDLSAQAQNQSLADLAAQVPEGSMIKAGTPNGAVAGPVMGADSGDLMAALQDDIPTGVPELSAGPQANPSLIDQLRNLRPAQEGLDILGKEGRYGRLQNQFKTGTGSKEDARGAGKLLRYAAGEVGAPTGKAAAQARPPLAQAAEAPVAPSWEADEAARWGALTPEQRAAELAGESTPSPAQIAPEATGAPSEAIPDAEPDWVKQAMAELEGRGAKGQRPKAISPEAPPQAGMEAPPVETPEEAAQVMADIDAFLNKQRAVEPSMPDVGRKAGSKGPKASPEAPKTGLEPSLVKKPGERGAIPTELAMRLSLGVAGAGVGAATDPFDDRTTSALAGFGVGAASPSAVPMISKLAQKAGADPDAVDAAFKKAGHLIPQVQRANYLYDAPGLLANTFFGPYGSASMGALEKFLGGDPRGLAVLKELNPVSFGKEFPSALEEAKGLIGRVERGEGGEAYNALTNPFEKGIQIPGTAMTGGDVTGRRFLERGGFSGPEARQMTLTSEPFTPWGHSSSHLKGFLNDMLFPFKRTPINIAEQGALRTPGLGFLMQGIGQRAGTRPADSLRQELVQQGLGAAVFGGTEQLGENMSPEQAKLYRRFITNSAGPYSLLAGAGMAVGQGAQRGQSPVSSLTRNLTQQLPVPSTDSLEDLGRMLYQASEGQEVDVPRGMSPALLRQIQEEFAEREREKNSPWK